MLFAWILFAIIGWCEFTNPPGGGSARMVLMIVFVVLMLLWLLAGVTGFEVPRLIVK